MTDNQGISPQRRSRIAAIQALYQLNFFAGERSTADVLTDIENYYLKYDDDSSSKEQVNMSFIKELLNYAARNQEDIDRVVSERLTAGWTLTRISTNLLSLLRIAVAEITKFKDTDAAVIINEYVDLAKLFENEQGSKFVNASLDKIIKNIRG
jgi:transcription antitermination protein NusB